MFWSDTHDTLAAAHEHGRQLRAEAAAERLRGTPAPRRALAVSLHRAANRLDPSPLSLKAALK